MENLDIIRMIYVFIWIVVVIALIRITSNYF